MNTEHSTRAGWRNLLLVLGLLAALARAQVTNPLNVNLSEDTDQDGISNADEVALGLDPYNPYNGLSTLDGAAFIVAWERYLGASSSTVDTDGDGWSDFDEVMVYQTNLFDERSLPGPISNPPAVTTSQPIATSTTAATPSTSLITNGDFSKTNISTWIDGKKLKGYNGSGFEWAAGSVEGWSAYAGSTIEVWNTGTRVVELNGDKSNYGIQQKVETAKPGAYLLTWRSLGRTQEAAPAKNKKTPPAPDNSYFVQVQVGEGSGGRAIKTENFTAGGDRVLVFQLSENDLTAANGKGIYIAFIPTNGSNSYGSLISGVNLLPVEVVNASKVPVSELKIGKMAESGVLSGTGTLDIDKDSDRFFIRIPGAASLGTSTVKFETVENPDTTYNDNATEIELTAQGGDLISKSLLLVSDDVDDNFPIDGVADDAPKDRTHKIQLEGKVKISAIKIGTNAEQAMDMKVPVNVKKTVKVKMVNCRFGFFDEESCWPTETITRIKKIMKERYAQVGIKLEITDAVGPVIDWSVGYVNNYPRLIGNVIDIPQQSKDIFNAAPVSSSDEVGIYLIRRLGGPASPHGCSTIPKYMTAADKTGGYANKAFAGLPGFRAGSSDYTSAHELLHVLLDAQHSDYPTEFDDINMLWHGTIQNNTIDDTKRISPNQETKTHANPLAK